MSNEYEWCFSKIDGFRRLSLALPPVPGEGEVLVRPRWVGICGSDIHTTEVWDGEFRPGHEWVGSVVGTGPGVRGYSIGDAVTGVPTLPCARCEACREGRTNLCSQGRFLGSPELGALRSWIVLPSSCLVKLGEPLHVGQVLHEILAVAEESMTLLQAVARRIEGATLAILGAGPVGVAIALTAQGRGLKPVLIEKRPARLEAARRLGLPGVSAAQASLDPAYGRAFRLLVDASSDHDEDSGAFGLLPLLAAREFHALIVAKYRKLPVLPRAFFGSAANLHWLRGISLGTMESSVRLWESRAEALGKGLISHRFAGHQVPEAFAQAQRKDESMKVVVELAS